MQHAFNSLLPLCHPWMQGALPQEHGSSPLTVHETATAPLLGGPTAADGGFSLGIREDTQFISLPGSLLHGHLKMAAEELMVREDSQYEVAGAIEADNDEDMTGGSTHPLGMASGLAIREDTIFISRPAAAGPTAAAQGLRVHQETVTLGGVLAGVRNSHGELTDTASLNEHMAAGGITAHFQSLQLATSEGGEELDDQENRSPEGAVPNRQRSATHPAIEAQVLTTLSDKAAAARGIEVEQDNEAEAQLAARPVEVCAHACGAFVY
jgi:hypothetical protein